MNSAKQRGISLTGWLVILVLTGFLPVLVSKSCRITWTIVHWTK